MSGTGAGDSPSCSCGSCDSCRVRLTGPNDINNHHHCGCGLCDACKRIKEEGGMNFGRLSWQLKLEVFKNLMKIDLLKCRQVSKTFLPRDLRLGVCFIDQNPRVEKRIYVSIWLDLNPKPLSMEERILARMFQFLMNDPINEKSGFSVSINNVDSLLQLQMTFLPKIRFLVLSNRQPGKEVQESLQMVVEGCRDIRCVWAIDVGTDTFNNFKFIFKNNKKLKQIVVAKSPGQEEVENEDQSILDYITRNENPRDFDFEWLEELSDLQILLVVNYQTKNIFKLPRNLTYLGIESGLPLEDIVWISKNITPVTLGLKSLGIIRNADFLKTMADSDSSIYTMLGAPAPLPEGAPDLTNPKFTSSLLKDLLKNPKLADFALNIALSKIHEEVELELLELRERWRPTIDELNGIQGVDAHYEVKPRHDLPALYNGFEIYVKIDRNTFSGF